MAHDKVRHQLFLPRPLSDRLETLASKPGATKSAILTDAVAAWLDRRDRSELEERFGLRLDRMSRGLGRIERDTHVVLESLAVFIHHELSIHAPLAENDQAGRALARKRFEAFIHEVGLRIAAGKRILDTPAERGR